MGDLKLDSIMVSCWNILMGMKEMPPTDPEKVMKFGDFRYPNHEIFFTSYLAPTGRDSIARPVWYLFHGGEGIGVEI